MSQARHIGFARLTQRDVSLAATRHEMLYSGRVGGAKAVFIFCDLSGRNLADADFTGAVLEETNLSGAKLDSASFFGADLSGYEMDGCDRSGAKLPMRFAEAAVVGV